MNSVLTFFNPYTIRARVYPSIPMLLPLYSVFIVGMNETGDTLTLVLFSLPFVIYSTSGIVRDSGYKLQQKKKFLHEKDEILANPAKYGLMKSETDSFFSSDCVNIIRVAAKELSEDKVVFDRNCIYGFRRNSLAIRPQMLTANVLGGIILGGIAFQSPSLRIAALSAILLCITIAGLSLISTTERSVRQASVDYITYLIKRSLKN